MYRLRLSRARKDWHRCRYEIKKIRSKERTAEQSEEEHMTIVDVDVDVRAMMHAEMDWGCSWSPGRGAG